MWEQGKSLNLSSHSEASLRGQPWAAASQSGWWLGVWTGMLIWDDFLILWDCQTAWGQPEWEGGYSMKNVGVLVPHWEGPPAAEGCLPGRSWHGEKICGHCTGMAHAHCCSDCLGEMMWVHPTWPAHGMCVSWKTSALLWRSEWAGRWLRGLLLKKMRSGGSMLSVAG